MGLIDAIGSEATVAVKVSELSQILRTEAISHSVNVCMLNGLKGGLPAEHILIMIGENQEVEND